MREKWILQLFVVLPLFGLSSISAIGQTQNKDSVKTSGTSEEIIHRPGNKADSVQTFIKDRADSLHGLYNGRLNQLDSLKNRVGKNSFLERSNHQIDSIQSAFTSRSDNLNGAFKNKLSKLDSAKASLQEKLDSLTTLNLPHNKISQRLDSLNRLRENTMESFEKKMQSLKDSAMSKLKTLELPPELSDKVSSLTKNIDGVSISGSQLDIPSLDIPSPLAKVNDVTNLDGLPKMNADSPLQSGITEKVGDVKIPDGLAKANELTNAQGNVDNVSNVTDQANKYSKEAEQVAKGNLDQTKNFSKAAEEKAVEHSGIKDLEKQTGTLDQYKDMATKAQDLEALKKEAIEKAKKAAVNHFAGKEEQLKAAMEKISKYKQKYSSMDGVKELSKKSRNEMRDKPLIERIVPGIAMQFQKKGDNLLVDLNPYAGYRFTGRLRAGLGWNQRIGYNTKQYSFNPSARIYGPRAFGEFKLGRGFSPRAEIEIMNTGIPPLPTTTYDPDQREWVWGAFVGIKKEYKIVKNIKGTAMIMTTLFNPDHKSPYADILNVRFGFEFPMKKKVKA